MVSPILQKRFLVFHEPPTIKSCTDIEQFVKQLLHLNYPNHMQSVERAVKMTTTASGQIAERKKQWIGKKILCHKKSCSG